MVQIKDTTFMAIVMVLAAIILIPLAGAAPVVQIGYDRFTLTATSAELNASGVTREFPDAVQLVSIAYGYSDSETSTQYITIDSGEGSGFDYLLPSLTPSGVTSSFTSYGIGEVILFNDLTRPNRTGDVIKFSASGCDSDLVSISVTYKRLGMK